MIKETPHKWLSVDCAQLAIVCAVVSAAWLATLSAQATTPVKGGATASVKGGETASVKGGETASVNGGATATVQGEAPAPLKGGVTASDLCVDLESRFGVTAHKSTKTGESKAKAVIDNVRLGSMAYHQGLRAGDLILDARGDKRQLLLTIERSGAVFKADLKPRAPHIDTTPTAIVRNKATVDFNMTPTAQSRLIAEHEVVLILDRTGSMASNDCPGGKTRWAWCQDQLSEFTGDMGGYLADVTLITFNGSFQAFPHCSVNKVAQICASMTPGGGTNTAAPLHQTMDEYLSHRSALHPNKPLLVAVITDGLPNEPGGAEAGESAVKQEIIRAANRCQKDGEITVTFLEVGTDIDGDTFLFDLANHLSTPYRIVDIERFSELKRVGLKAALMSALTGTHLQIQASELQQEMEDLMKQKQQLQIQMRGDK